MQHGRGKGNDTLIALQDTILQHFYIAIDPEIKEVKRLTRY